MHLLSSLVLSTHSGEQKLQENDTRLCGSQRRGAAAARSVVVPCGSGRRVEGSPERSFRFETHKAMAARRGKWHPSPVPTPRIIHLPQRSRLSRPSKVAAKAPPTRSPLVSGRNLGALFDEERSFSSNYSERRARVATSSGKSGGDSGEERWRSSGGVQFSPNGEGGGTAEAGEESSSDGGHLEIHHGNSHFGEEEDRWEEEIEELEDKLEELQVERSGRRRASESFRELQRSNARNFDRQASVLQRRLEKMANETSVREIREIAATEEKQYSDHHCRFLFISSSVTCKNTMDGRVEDTYSEDQASKDQPVTSWTISVARSEIRSFPLLSS